VVHVSRSDGLLHLEGSRDRVSYSSLKTGGVATMGSARGIIVEVMWSSSQRRMSQCDGPHQTSLPLLYCFLCIRP
jgi:hypothetical protein